MNFRKEEIPNLSTWPRGMSHTITKISRTLATSFWALFEFGCEEEVTIRGVIFFQEKNLQLRHRPWS